MRFVATTDWHIDAFSRFFATPQAALDAQFAEIKKPFAYAVKRGIRQVIVCGDIGEHPTISDEGKLRLLNLLLTYDDVLDIDIILGNHDVASSVAHGLRLVEELYRRGKFKTVRIHTKPTSRVIGGINVNFLPWPAVHPEGLPSPALNVCHLTLAGATRDNGTVTNRGLTLPKGKDFWLIGHLHTYQYGKRHLYPGTGWQKNFGEKGPKGWCDVTVTKEGGGLRVAHKHVDGKPALRLHNWKQATGDMLATISASPTDLYSIEMAEGEEIPPAVANMPNVVSIVGAKAQSPTQHPVDGETEGFDYTEGLESAISHLTEKQQQRAKALVTEALAQA